MRRQPQHIVEVVRHEDERDVERASQRVDLILQPAADDAIDGGERFVEQQDRRFASQRPRERHTLTFAAGQLVRPAIDTALEMHLREQPFGAGAAFGGRAMAERRDHVAGRGQMRKERVFLKDEPDGAAMRRLERAGRVSVQVLAPARTIACAGFDSPAIARRIVVLPLPDGPKIASTSPASHENSTSSAIGVDWRRATERPASATTRTHAARQRGGERQRGDGDDQQRRRHHAGRAIVERLHAVVDRHAQRARAARQVAADHQHDAELAERVSERQHGGGDDTGPRERQLDAGEALPRRQSAARRRVTHIRGNRLEAPLDRLDDERDVGDERGEQQTLERERAATAR